MIILVNEAAARVMIRVVLTDLDGVIRRWPATQFSSVEDAHGLPRGCMAATAFHESLLTDVITGVVTDAEWRRRIAARLGAQFDTGTAAAAVAAWSASAGEVDTGTLAVLQAARSAVASRPGLECHHEACRRPLPPGHCRCVRLHRQLVGRRLRQALRVLLSTRPAPQRLCPRTGVLRRRPPGKRRRCNRLRIPRPSLPRRQDPGASPAARRRRRSCPP